LARRVEQRPAALPRYGGAGRPGRSEVEMISCKRLKRGGTADRLGKEPSGAGWSSWSNCSRRIATIRTARCGTSWRASATGI
jgi:hypothetical protein